MAIELLVKAVLKAYRRKKGHRGALDSPHMPNIPTPGEYARYSCATKQQTDVPAES